MQLTKKILIEYLSQHNLMQVATYGSEHPWITSVYYTFDDNLNLYFLSSPNTIHCQQILENPQVAVAITNTQQSLSAKKKGVQLFGTAQQISDVAKIKHALSLWKQHLGVKDQELSYENMAKKVIKSKMYKITPQKIKFFNQELFDVPDGKEPILEM